MRAILSVLLWISDLLSQPHNPMSQFLDSTSSCLCRTGSAPLVGPCRHTVTPTLCSGVPTAVMALLPRTYCSLQRLPAALAPPVRILPPSQARRGSPARQKERVLSGAPAALRTAHVFQHVEHPSLHYRQPHVLPTGL